MRVERCANAEEFLTATEDYRANDDVMTNVLGSVAIVAATNARPYDDCWWWIVRESATVVGAALRTAPFGLSLGPMRDDVAAVLANNVADVDDDLPWVAGPDAAVSSFVTSYRSRNTPGSRRPTASTQRQNVYALGTLIEPDVAGAARLATMDDHELVERWTSDFHEFVDGVAPLRTEGDRLGLIAKIESGYLRLWHDGPVPTAMAGHASPVESPKGTMTRLGPVFTPESLRGRGYGSAVTSALCRELVDRGSGVMLFADADYAVSNAVYQHLGFRLQGTATMLKFQRDH